MRAERQAAAAQNKISRRSRRLLFQVRLRFPVCMQHPAPRFIFLYTYLYIPAHVMMRESVSTRELRAATGILVDGVYIHGGRKPSCPEMRMRNE